METTTNAIPVETFRTALKLALEEAFENVHGFFLDKGESLFETLASITAEEASRSLGPRSGNIAAKVNHVRVYLDAIAANAAAGTYVPADWDSSWQVGEVSEAEWIDLVARLDAAYRDLLDFAGTNETWNDQFVGGAFGIVAHTAYHLGEIRQALNVVRP